MNNIVPKVSIIIPTLNMVNLLRNTIKGISIAADVSFEVICVNQASVDDTKDYLDNIAESILKQNPNFVRLVVIHNKFNRFMSGALNQGYLHASGQYICICANDILICPNYFSWGIKKLEENPKIGAISPWYTEDPQFTNIDNYYHYYDRLPKKDEWTINWSFSVLQILTRELVDKVGEWDECLESSCQDNDYGFRMYLAGFDPTAWKGMVCAHTFGSFGRGSIKNERKVSINDSRYFHTKWGVYTDKTAEEACEYARNRAKEGNYISKRQKRNVIQFNDKIKTENHGLSLFR